MESNQAEQEREKIVITYENRPRELSNISKSNNICIKEVPGGKEK